MMLSKPELQRLYQLDYLSHTRLVETQALQTLEHVRSMSSIRYTGYCVGTDLLLITSAARQASAKHSHAAARTYACCVTFKKNLSPATVSALYNGLASWEKLTVCLFISSKMLHHMNIESSSEFTIFQLDLNFFWLM